MTLFFDFDGTIVDVSERYYKLHLHCLRDSSNPIDPEEYWTLKRDNVPESAIIENHYLEEDFASYEQKRMTLIEDPAFLVYDVLLPGARETLDTLSQSHALILVTLRKKSDALQAQFDQLDLRQYFKNVLVAPPIDGPWQTKVSMIRPYMMTGDWIIGDTDADVLAAQHLGLTSCATLTGIRSEEKLRAMHPDHIISDITELPALLS
jgi:phosphoglycolate phosphatase